MTKYEFLAALEKELAGVPTDERVAALQYYNEYIDEAGPEREEEIIQELGSVQHVAAEVRANAAAPENATTPPPAQTDEVKEAFEEGRKRAEVNGTSPRSNAFGPDFEPNASAFGAPEGSGWAQTEAEQQTHSQQGGYASPHNGQSGSQWAGFSGIFTSVQEFFTNNFSSTGALKIIAIVFAAIILLPLTMGLAAAAAGMLVAVIVLFLCPFILAFALGAAGIASIVVGAVLTPLILADALIFIGVGIMLLGLSHFPNKLGVWLMGTVLPGTVRKIVFFFQRLLGFGTVKEVRE